MKLEKAIYLITNIFNQVYRMNDNKKRFQKELRKFLNNFVNKEER